MTSSGRHRAPRRGVAVPLAAMVVGLLVLGVFFAVRSEQSSGSPPSAAGRPSAASTPAVVHSSASTTIPGLVGSASPTSAVADVSAPVRLSIPSIGVTTTLQSLALLKDGTLQSPSSWDVAGWYAQGVKPGEIGPAVIAGHVDSTKGPAVFYRLNQLAPGAQATVAEQNGQVLTFVVDDVQSFPKDQFPSQLVYGPTPYPVLRLITCTGDFDYKTHNYLSNLVVTAHLVIGGTS